MRTYNPNSLLPPQMQKYTCDFLHSVVYARTYNLNYLLPSQMQKCTCDFLYPAFDLCGGEA
ncbi:hypothetical protein BX23_24290 [Escherichia coli O118:H16 str. 2009C-4446]|nr:hypothetical protein BX23_24290 [Escherichia coli O118:H16 str. 2009C-4446]